MDKLITLQNAILEKYYRDEISLTDVCCLLEKVEDKYGSDIIEEMTEEDSILLETVLNGYMTFDDVTDLVTETANEKEK